MRFSINLLLATNGITNIVSTDLWIKQMKNIASARG